MLSLDCELGLELVRRTQGMGEWRQDSATHQNNERPTKVDRAWRRGPLMPLSPVGSEPPGQRQRCVGVRPLWMKGPALYSRIQARFVGWGCRGEAWGGMSEA